MPIFDTHGKVRYENFHFRGILKFTSSLNSILCSLYTKVISYQLLSINETEEYVKKLKHLPDIPSAEQVVREGLDLAVMDAKLLRKVEELTLHIIHLNKEIERLKKGHR